MKLKAAAFLLVTAALATTGTTAIPISKTEAVCGHNEHLFHGGTSCDDHCKQQSEVCVAAWVFTGSADSGCKTFKQRTASGCANAGSQGHSNICKCLKAQTSFQFEWKSETNNWWSKCTEDKPCKDGQGDCDGDDQCGAGLFCNYNTGTVVWPRYIHDKDTLAPRAKGVDYCTRKIRVDLKRTCGKDFKCGFEVTGKCTNSCPDKQMVCKDIKYSKNYGRLGVYDVPSEHGNEKICQFKITEIKHTAGKGKMQEGEGNCKADADCAGSSNGLERVYCNLRQDGSSNLWYSQKLGPVGKQGLTNVGFCVPKADVGTCADAGKVYEVATEEDKFEGAKLTCSAGDKKVTFDECKTACGKMDKCSVFGWKGGRFFDDKKVAVDYCYLMNGCKSRSETEYAFYRLVEDDFGYCAKEEMWSVAEEDVECASGDLQSIKALTLEDCGDKVRKNSNCSGVMIFGKNKCACVTKNKSCKLQTAKGSIVYTTKQKVYKPLEKQCTNAVEHSQKAGQNYISGKSYKITCLPKYTMDSTGKTTKSSTCNNGTWSAKLPQDLCKHTCTVTVANSVPAGPYNSGAEATLECLPGFHLDNHSQQNSTCGKDGKFTSAFAKCEENVCVCDPARGTPAKGKDCLKNGGPKCAACNKTCTLVGHSCLKNCEAKDVEPENGISLSKRTYPSGAEVTISCNKAISTLKGSSESTCRDGAWSAKPTCPLDPYCANAKQDWNHECKSGFDNISFLFKTVCKGHYNLQYKTTEASFQQKCCVEGVGNKDCHTVKKAVTKRKLEEDRVSTLERIAQVRKIMDHVH